VTFEILLPLPQVQQSVAVRSTLTSLRALASTENPPAPSYRHPPPSASSSAPTSAQMDHSYCLESPMRIKKFNHVVNKLLLQKQQLKNARKREHRAKKTVKKLLVDVSRLHLLKEEAAEQLAAFESKTAS
jgi:hypothetical protein